VTLVRNAEWLNLNSQRRYPLASAATGRDASGAFALPDDFLLELSFPWDVGLGLDPDGFLLRRVELHAGGATLQLAHWNGGTPLAMAAAAAPFAGHQYGDVHVLAGVGDFARHRGSVTLGRLEALQAQPAGVWLFTPAGAALEADGLRPYVPGIMGLTVGSDTLDGVVELAEGFNLRITVTRPVGQPPRVRFDAISGEGLSAECGCAGAPTVPIRRINGVGPTATGDFFLPNTDCVSWETVPNGLRAVNSCSTPCCGCAELEQLTRQMETLSRNNEAMARVLASLESFQKAAPVALLGKLGDDACRPCAG